jgi:REP element-mobilizing transposase RayT
MGRPLRVVEPNGIYHIAARGNNKQGIFDDTLRALFLWELTQVARQFDWWIYAWALMSNHFHLVLQISDKGLSEGMRQLNTRLARASNARFDRINHCLGRRFWSDLIDTDANLCAAIRYVLWNPARAGIEDQPGDCPWTSFRATVGLEWGTEPLALGRLLSFFGATPETARRAFRQFVLDERERSPHPGNGGEPDFR